MRKLVASLFAVSVVALGCSDPTPHVEGSSSAARSAAAAPDAKPTAVAICDLPGEDDHLCFEYLDEGVAKDREVTCSTGLRRDAACPEKDRLGSCRLSDGSVRYAYPPKTANQAERACRDANGKFATGGVAPASDPKALVRCEGKVDGGCEEETSFTEARAKQAEEECSTYGGKSSRGEPCERDEVIATCDLDGPRLLVFNRATSFGAAERYCAGRRGKFEKATSAPGSPSASASASASAAPDLDPPEPKAEVIIHQR